MEIPSPAEYWKSLQRIIEAEPGWRFQLVMDNRRLDELASVTQPLISEVEILSRLEAAKQLFNQGIFESALLVCWSALEGILRQRSRELELNLPNQGPAALITALFSEGDLDRVDYDALMRLMQTRNQVAHGYLSEVNRQTVEEAIQLTDRLREDQHSQE